MRRAVWISAAACTLAFPSGAGADTALIGPPALPDTASALNCGYTGLSPCTRAVLFQVTSAPGVMASLPSNGTVSSWRARVTINAPATASLMTVRPQPNGKFAAIDVSDPATALDGTTSNPVALAYKAGDRLAVVLTAGSPNGIAAFGLRFTADATYTAFTSSFAPGSGEQAVPSTANSELLFNATVDTIPAPPPGPTAPAQAAKLTALSISPKAFEAANVGGSVIAKVGGKVGYTLDRASSVTFTVSRPSSGRKSGKKCVKPTRRNRGKKKCTRYKKLKGSFTLQGAAGANSFTFSGRLNNKALRKGKYRLEAVATNGTAKSALATSPFRIKG